MPNHRVPNRHASSNVPSRSVPNRPRVSNNVPSRFVPSRCARSLLRPESLRPEPRPVSVLKSGVIDEMAYTLFTDGSIEAQMPDGTMRFASIEELRRHLDQNG